MRLFFVSVATVLFLVEFAAACDPPFLRARERERSFNLSVERHTRDSWERPGPQYAPQYAPQFAPAPQYPGLIVEIYFRDPRSGQYYRGGVDERSYYGAPAQQYGPAPGTPRSNCP